MTTTGASATSVRQRNLARVLTLLHLDGPRSRAALTEETGLNRSTIGDLVGELAALGLVEERAPDAARRAGRPSPVVVTSGSAVAIAAHPEIDALTLAAVTLDRSVIARVRIPWRDAPSPEVAAAAIAARIAQWRAGALADHRIVGVGVAVPGLVRTSDGVVRDAPHLRWRDAPLAALVQSAAGLPTTVGNDASLGARAEHLFGAARGHADVIYLNGGASGIGGGVIAHGTMLGGAGGYAGEFGQNRPGIEDASDRRAPGGVLEDEVGRARLLAALGASATDADDHALARALQTTSAPAARAERDRQRRILSTALANAVNVLNPSVVVLGGFLAALASSDLPGLTAAVRGQAMPACAESLDLRLASLADDRLLIGAAEAAFEPVLADPASAG
ncbi:ROK family transcriptional regulator [Microbacterium sp. cx-59]|uniref:ROK family transcriptional regulator n=1 Tax=Microbacterium sp. cx-59 TaxID=2891207 RepID=UPI001E6143B7|nr:ROK family transcriptional regulator [Microbacterium sp. cx-59]MCC4908288.1 ROK family transcriptional regulator [Microbacterium sp. cx-59]